jgi:hypothetical protein
VGCDNGLAGMAVPSTVTLDLVTNTTCMMRHGKSVRAGPFPQLPCKNRSSHHLARLVHKDSDPSNIQLRVRRKTRSFPTERGNLDCPIPRLRSKSLHKSPCRRKPIQLFKNGLPQYKALNFVHSGNSLTFRRSPISLSLLTTEPTSVTSFTIRLACV